MISTDVMSEAIFCDSVDSKNSNGKNFVTSRLCARQSFRCTACGRNYRRIPLLQHCVCGSNLIQTITRGSVEKYLKLAKRLSKKYNVGLYQKGRIQVLSDELDLVFGKSKGDQALLTDYAN